MRVIAGILKGRKLLSVPGTSTRPILDRVKTSLFDTLNPHLPDARVLDLFAGSGSLGIEAISRGALSCTFLDIEKAAIATIQTNIENIGIKSQTTVKRIDAFAYLRHSTNTYDIIFVAPPQYKGLWIEAVRMIAERPTLVASPAGMVVVQIDPKEYETVALSHFVEQSRKTLGNTLLLMFSRL
jgi:16S rRNA (guanine(966)-N(2))-methyltransferase RsmD